MELSVEEKRDLDREIEQRYLYDATFKQRVDFCAKMSLIEHVNHPMTEDGTNEMFWALVKSASMAIVMSERNL